MSTNVEIDGDLSTHHPANQDLTIRRGRGRPSGKKYGSIKLKRIKHARTISHTMAQECSINMPKKSKLTSFYQSTKTGEPLVTSHITRNGSAKGHGRPSGRKKGVKRLTVRKHLNKIVHQKPSQHLKMPDTVTMPHSLNQHNDPGQFQAKIVHKDQLKDIGCKGAHQEMLQQTEFSNKGTDKPTAACSNAGDSTELMSNKLPGQHFTASSQCSGPALTRPVEKSDTSTHKTIVSANQNDPAMLLEIDDFDSESTQLQSSSSEEAQAGATAVAQERNHQQMSSCHQQMPGTQKQQYGHYQDRSYRRPGWNRTDYYRTTPDPKNQYKSKLPQTGLDRDHSIYYKPHDDSHPYACNWNRQYPYNSGKFVPSSSCTDSSPSQSDSNTYVSEEVCSIGFNTGQSHESDKDASTNGEQAIETTTEGSQLGPNQTSSAHISPEIENKNEHEISDYQIFDCEMADNEMSDGEGHETLHDNQASTLETRNNTGEFNKSGCESVVPRTISLRNTQTAETSTAEDNDQLYIQDLFPRLIQSVREYIFRNQGSLHGFVLLSSSLDHLKLGQFYDSAFPSITIEVQRNTEVCIEVHKTQLREDHPVWKQVPKYVQTSNQLIKLTSCLSNFEVCIGNYGKEDIENGSKIKSKVFYIEGSFGAKRRHHCYNSTVRSMQCALLVSRKTERCKKCQETRVALRVKKSRLMTSKTRFPHGAPRQKTHRDQTKEELSQRLGVQNKKVKNLQARNKRLEKALNHIKKHGQELTENGNEDMGILMKANAKEFESLYPDENLEARVFWDSQMKLYNTKAKCGMRWDPRIIKWCIYIHSKSPKAYEVLTRSKFIQLPTARTLFDYTHALPSGHGLQPANIEHFIQDVAAKGIYVDPGKNFFVLLQDEIRIKDNLVFDRHSGELVGFVDIASFSSPQFSSNGVILENIDISPEGTVKQDSKMGSKKNFKKSKGKSGSEKDSVAKYLLVLMVAGLAEDIRYPIAAYATTGITSDLLFEVVWPTVRTLEIDCGLHVMAITCDGASPNRKFFRIHGLPEQERPIHWCWNPYSLDENRKLFFVSDPPHLLKTSRNCTGNSFAHRRSRTMQKGGQNISWLALRQLFEEHCSGVWSTCPKLMIKHLWLTSWSQMKVNLAAQVFSKTVAEALRYHYGERYSELAFFIELLNDWFDCMNVRRFIKKGKNKYNDNLKPYSSVDDPRFVWLHDVFLKYFDDWLDELKNHGFTPAQRSVMTLSHQTLDGLKITTKSIVECSKYMLHNGVDFVLTNKFCQDPLEALFGELRKRGGGNDNPTAYDCHQGLRCKRVTGSTAFDPLRGNVQAHKDCTVDATPLARLKRPQKPPT